jgi:hypothetical protein
LNKKADTGPLSSLSVCAFSSSSFIMFYNHQLSCQILMLFLLLTLWNFETVQFFILHKIISCCVFWIKIKLLQ